MAGAPKTSVKVVSLFSGPRTGSTRVLSLLTGFDQLYARAEIFNPEVAESLEAECADLARFAGIEGVADPHDRRLVAWMRAKPNLAIDWLLHRAAGRTLVFKLFPGHITDAREQARVIQRPDIAHVVIRRRPIDVYISLEKAKVTETMRHVDTTGVRIRGDVGDFLAISRRIREWYRYCTDLMQRAGRPHAAMSYIAEIAQPDSVTLTAIQGKLRQLGVAGGTYHGPVGPVINRQDRSDSYAEKMSNWEEFSATLKAQAAYLDAFQE